MELPPIPTTSTPVIAARTLMFVTKKKRQAVHIRIGQPVRDVPTVGGLDWRCPISMTGLKKSRRPQGIGVDSLQALIDALKAVEVEIDARARNSGGRFEWLGAPWHGLPEISLSLPATLQSPRPASRSRRKAGRERRRGAAG
jgi:uncharacterized protein DUF6968